MTYTYIPGFIPAPHATALFAMLWLRLPWEQRGKARKECWMNDFNQSYTYGSPPYERTFNAVEWDENVKGVRDALRVNFGCHYEGCFVNGYEGERNGLDWHADDDPSIDHSKPIAVVSLGQERAIQVRHESTREVTEFMLGSGSLFLMPAGSQFTHKHRIPKVGRAVGSRVSLTFRSLFATSFLSQTVPRYAVCDQCGWKGERIAMKSHPNMPLDEFCPNCGSHDTHLVETLENNDA